MLQFLVYGLFQHDVTDKKGAWAHLWLDPKQLQASEHLDAERVQGVVVQAAPGTPRHPQRPPLMRPSRSCAGTRSIPRRRPSPRGGDRGLAKAAAVAEGRQGLVPVTGRLRCLVVVHGDSGSLGVYGRSLHCLLNDCASRERYPGTSEENLVSIA